MRAVNSIAIVLLWTAVAGPAGAASVATYRGLEPDTFMKRWLVLSPIRVSTDTQPEEAAQKAAFARDFLQTAGGETSVQPAADQTLQIDGIDYRWRPVSAESDAIDLSNGEASQDYVIAYAWAEIDLERATTWLFGMGSDDALKVWLNGKLVHENWVDRSARMDDDLVELPLQKGKNRLLLKIQNGAGGWEFMCRPLGQAALVKKFVAAAGLGDLDQMKKLLDRGVKVDGADRRGLTAWQGAKIHGRKEAAEFLQARGASMRLPQKPQRVVDKAFQEIVADTGAGVAVLVAQNGKILFEKGYGLANLEHHVAVTPATKFRIGSITKQFVAAAILKLHEQAKINFDDKLSKFMPDFPRGEQVTIHHLLTHTSGIHSYTGKPDFFETAPLFIKPEVLIQSFKNDPYDFDPGTRWSYNNSGYFLLGVIIEKVSGKSYEEFLRTSFFGPLGMTNTGVHHGTDVIANEAHGYAFAGGKLKKALNWDMSRAGGAGSLYSTVGDLYRWNEGVFNGKVLAPASLKAAFTPVKTKANADEKLEEGYGYGWGIGKMRGLTQISHSGGLHGFTTCLMRVLEDKLTVTVLANASPAPPGLDPGVLANEIVQLYLANKLEWQPTLVVNRTVSPQVYDAYVGRYDYGTVMTISREGNRLFAQLAGQNKHEIFPKSETEFFWKVADAQVTFVKDEKGVVTKAIHRQRGQTLHAARLPDQVSARIDPAMLNDYVGKYDYGAGQAILTVSREGDRLFAQLTGQPKFEIFPKSDTEFFWQAVAARITFVKDEKGKVTKESMSKEGGSSTRLRLSKPN